MIRAWVNMAEAGALAPTDTGTRDTDNEVRFSVSGAADRNDVALLVKALKLRNIHPAGPRR